MGQITGHKTYLGKVVMIEEMLDHQSETALIVKLDIVESIDMTADGYDRALRTAELALHLVRHSVYGIAFPVKCDAVELFEIHIVDQSGFVISGNGINVAELTVRIENDQIHIQFFRSDGKRPAQYSLVSA